MHQLLGLLPASVAVLLCVLLSTSFSVCPPCFRYSEYDHNDLDSWTDTNLNCLLRKFKALREIEKKDSSGNERIEILLRRRGRP